MHSLGKTLLAFALLHSVLEWLLRGCRRAERSYSTFKVRRENPLIQGKEQWLRFAGAAVKSPTSKVRETQVGRLVLKEGRHTKTIITEN